MRTTLSLSRIGYHACSYYETGYPPLFDASVVTVSHLARSVDFGSVLRKKLRFRYVRFSFYYAATVCGYGADRGGDKISQKMGGGWARAAQWVVSRDRHLLETPWMHWSACRLSWTALAERQLEFPRNNRPKRHQVKHTLVM